MHASQHCPLDSCVLAAALLQLIYEPLLTVAVRKGDKATAAALIEAGADVNARDYVRAVRLCMLLW